MYRATSGSSASSSGAAHCGAAVVAAGLAAEPLGGGDEGVRQNPSALLVVHAYALHVAHQATCSSAGPSYIHLWDINGLPVLKTVSVDANVKLSRYRSAGRSAGHANAPRTWSVFLGAAHDVVWNLAGESALPLSLPAADTAAAAAGAAGEVAADDVELELQVEETLHCHPRLHCDREFSQRSSILDECGMVGGVCSHGQPLAGWFMAMPAPERSLFYDALVSKGCTAAVLDILYLDIGCSYKRHWELYMGHAAGPTHVKVPWWHAKTHGESCYLQNSGMYHPGGLLMTSSSAGLSLLTLFMQQVHVRKQDMHAAYATHCNVACLTVQPC